MSASFVIEDNFHAEILGRYPTLSDAAVDLDRVVALPWGEPPNAPPCGNLECVRDYRILNDAGAVLANIRMSGQGIERGSHA